MAQIMLRINSGCSACGGVLEPVAPGSASPLTRLVLAVDVPPRGAPWAPTGLPAVALGASQISNLFAWRTCLTMLHVLNAATCLRGCVVSHSALPSLSCVWPSHSWFPSPWTQGLSCLGAAHRCGRQHPDHLPLRELHHGCEHSKMERS